MAIRRQATYTQRCLSLFLFLILISLLTVGALAEPSFLPLTKVVRRSAESEDQSLEYWLRSVRAFASQLIRHRYSYRRMWHMENEEESRNSSLDAESTDPGLLKKHSTFKSYTTSTGTYPSIRTFYRPHPQAGKLPSVPTPLPLLVFVHGLGGSLAQFNPLLTSLVNVAPCLGIDLPGCGLSKYEPTAWEHYTPAALAELLGKVIEVHCRASQAQGVVLIAHSMGCSLSVLLASPLSALKTETNYEILGLVAVCPRASPFSGEQATPLRRLLSIPTPIFDLWRRWDRRGGPESSSVARFVGPHADAETKQMQERYNSQSRTAVWRRMAWGMLPKLGTGLDGPGSAEGLPPLEVWGSLQIPLFLVAGEADNITRPEEVAKISEAIRETTKPNKAHVSDGAVGTAAARSAQEGFQMAPGKGGSDTLQDHSTANTETTIIKDIEKDAAMESDDPSAYSRRGRVVKTSILPAPASHALLYDPTTYRTLAGLIHTFLYDHVDSRLSLGWQLQHLSTGGKWDVKNLAKWQAVKPVSEPIAGIFRALKTLRQIDSTHRPDIFVREWKDKIKAVVDISHESPVYDPKDLDEGGMEYHKFPTVSKIPPTPEETRDFNKLIDRLRAKLGEVGREDALIGVHCHYGFNRTGFFLCCYLIEREGYGVQQAIDEFAAHRPPGIRHEHFLDTLFVRYCVGLKRAPTL
ncbi:MAG: hypothetical protein Q9191_006864 [Dirinaria sp. TL-2023a]